MRRGKIDEEKRHILRTNYLLITLLAALYIYLKSHNCCSTQVLVPELVIFCLPACFIHSLGIRFLPPWSSPPMLPFLAKIGRWEMLV